VTRRTRRDRMRTLTKVDRLWLALGFGGFVLGTLYWVAVTALVVRWWLE